MTRVIIAEVCGNSPRNIFLEKLTIAFAKVEAEWILENVTEDVRWNIIGEELVSGKAEAAARLERMAVEEVEELTVSHVATHGRAGAVDGMLKMKNGERLAFCHVCEFTRAGGTQVRGITSYVIKTK